MILNLNIKRTGYYHNYLRNMQNDSVKLIYTYDEIVEKKNLLSVRFSIMFIILNKMNC